MGLVLDVSNHDFSTFSESCFVESGVERLIIGCWDKEVTRSMLRRARAAGITVEDLYAYLYFGLPYEGREVDNAISLAREEGGIVRIWLDVEATGQWEAPGMTPERRIRALHHCVDRVQSAHIEAGIYTGRWYWPNFMANTTAFSHLKLWHSEYGPASKPAPPVYTVNYGGWRTVSVHQYTSALFLCGRNRDANYWWIEDNMDILTRLRTDPQYAKEFVEALLLHPDAKSLLGTPAKDIPIHLAIDLKYRQAWAVMVKQLLEEAGLPRPETGDVRQTLADVFSRLAEELRAGSDDDNEGAT